MTTKACTCGNTHLILFRTQNAKGCADCHTIIPWHLDRGQKGVGYDESDDVQNLRSDSVNSDIPSGVDV